MPLTTQAISTLEFCRHHVCHLLGHLSLLSARGVELGKAYHHYSQVAAHVPGLERAQFMLGLLHLHHPEVVPEEHRGLMKVCGLTTVILIELEGCRWRSTGVNEKFSSTKSNSSQHALSSYVPLVCC